MSLLIGALLLASQNKAIDRSAEAALRQVFVRAGACHRLHIHCDRTFYEYACGRWDPWSKVDVWLGDGKRFRYADEDDYNGGGTTAICDGSQLLIDGMSDDSPAKVGALKERMSDLDTTEPILYFLDGEKGFDQMVDKDRPISFLAAQAGDERAIRFHYSKIGGIQVFYREGSQFPDRIEQFNAPFWPEDASPYPDQPYVREVFTINPFPNDQGLFVVSSQKRAK